MKSVSGIAMGLVGFALGVLVTIGLGDHRASAQPQPPGAPRYQVSAYAGPVPAGHGHGCYILDTVTGDLWHAHLGGKREKVAEKLP